MSFSKKNLKLFKIAKGGKFAAESVSNDIISLKCLFYPNFEVFWQKSENIERRKIRKYDEKGVFFREKTFPSF